MPGGSAFRLFHSHYQHLFRWHHHAAHHSSSVADPNCIAAKKSVLHRLFTCPAKAQQQASAKQPDSFADQSASTCNREQAPVLPFYLHAGNAVRVAATRPLYQQRWAGILANDEEVAGSRTAGKEHSGTWSSSSWQRGRGQDHGHLVVCGLRWQHRQRPICSFRLLLLSQSNRLRCTEEEHESAEEDEDEHDHFKQQRHRSTHNRLHTRLGRALPYIQALDSTYDADDSNTLIVTAASPLYHQLLSLYSSRAPTLSVLSPVLRSSSLPLPGLGWAARAGADLPDEKNNDHIPLPQKFAPAPVSSAVATVSERGALYVGAMSEAGQDGLGMMRYHSGDVYQGGWRAGLHHGYGVMQYRGKSNDESSQDAGTYSGMYVRGERDGRGMWEGADGSKYDGEWQQGKRNGQGKQWQDGRLCYDGEWRCDERSGYGTAYFTHGQYEGEWLQGLMHGYGSLTYSNGELWEGEWQHGQMHGEGMRIAPDGLRMQREMYDTDRAILTIKLPRKTSVRMGAGIKDLTAEEERVAPGTPELLQLLSQVVDLQSQLQSKLSRVESLLIAPSAMALTAAA